MKKKEIDKAETQWWMLLISMPSWPQMTQHYGDFM